MQPKIAASVPPDMKSFTLAAAALLALAVSVPASAALCTDPWGSAYHCRIYRAPPVGWTWGLYWYPGHWHQWNGHPWNHAWSQHEWREHHEWHENHG
jgi:hypothetical protein